MATVRKVELQFRRNAHCYKKKLTLSGTLPSEDDSPVDADLRAQIDSPKWFVNIIVIHDGTVRQVCVHLAVNSQVRMAISPLRPGVALVVHPRFLTKGLVGNCN